MQIPFDITGVPDSGAAVSVATSHAHASGFTHVSVVAVQQLGRSPALWRVVLFCANSQGLTRRGPGVVQQADGGSHWCQAPSLCEYG